MKTYTEIQQLARFGNQKRSDLDYTHLHNFQLATDTMIMKQFEQKANFELAKLRHKQKTKMGGNQQHHKVGKNN